MERVVEPLRLFTVREVFRLVKELKVKSTVVPEISLRMSEVQVATAL